MKYKFDIKRVNITDLNSVDYRQEFLSQTKLNFDQIIGNLIYTQTNDIDLADKAKDIHKSKDIILTEREKPIFEKIINESNYMQLIKRAIIEQIKVVDDE